jgi:hypothetical protein
MKDFSIPSSTTTKTRAAAVAATVAAAVAAAAAAAAAATTQTTQVTNMKQTALISQVHVNVDWFVLVACWSFVCFFFVSHFSCFVVFLFSSFF